MRKNAVLMTVLMVALVFALMLVAMPAVGAGDVACDWTGTWDTCWGKMELVQTGNDVTGTASLTLPKRTNLNRSYKQDKGDKILGRVFDNELRGCWLRYPNDPPENAGGIVFIISEDCSSFDGKWRYGILHEYGEEKWDSSKSSNWDGNWTGSRVGPSPSKPPSKQTVCASFKPRIAGASESKPAEFTIGGTKPQKVRITQPAENFDIVNVYGGKYGGRVYRVIEGESWGSLTLEPGTYRLSCSGGGVSGLMSATVCIEYPAAKEVPPSDNQTVPPKPKEKEKPPMEEVKPSLPRGPIEKIIIRPQDNLAATELIMEIGKEKRFMAWGEDAAGHKISVTVKDWEVSDTSIGSIDKDGIFKAGPNEGEVKIRATVKNQEGNDITGAFSITVTVEPPITFVGKVKLYDEHNTLLRIPAGGVTIDIQGVWFENRKARDQAAASPAGVTLKPVGDVQTDAGGEFTFTVPAGGFVLIHCWIHVCYLTSPAGYEWDAKLSPSGGGQSNAADWEGSIKKAGSTIPIAPEGFGCFKLWLEKMPTSLSIDGEVTHHGKPVERAKVRLFDNGNSVEDDWSEYDGYYELPVGNLPKGSYRLTVKPYKPKGHVTVHDWLYIKKAIWVDLPLQTQKKTINIEMISWGEKVGYTGP